MGNSMVIGGTAVYVPEERLTVESFADQGLLSPNEAASLLGRGMASVPCEKELPSPDMLDLTLYALLNRFHVDPELVRYVVMPYLYYSFPYTKDVLGSLRRKYGFRQAVCFSLRDQLCSGYLMGMYAAGKLLEAAEDDATVVLLTVEKCLLPGQRYGGGVLITGDACAASLLGKRLGGDRVLAVRSVTDIRTLQQGKLKNRADDVPNYFYFVNLAKVIRRTLADAGLDFGDLKVAIPNNITQETWRQLAVLLKISPELFYTEGPSVSGHLNTCDLPVNYARLALEGKLRPGDYYAMISLGNGGVIGCAVCQKGNDPPVLAHRP